MHLSEGRTRFISGGRLFKGIGGPPESPARSSTVKIQKTPKKPTTYAEQHVNQYSTYSAAKRVGITPKKNHYNNATNISDVIMTEPPKQEEITLEGITLFVYEVKNSSWKFTCSGTLHIAPSTNQDGVADYSHMKVLIIDKDNETQLSGLLSTRNLPNVQEQELFHVWRKGPGSLFEDENAYAIQVTSIQQSQQLCELYDDMLTREGLPPRRHLKSSPSSSVTHPQQSGEVPEEMFVLRPIHRPASPVDEQQPQFTTPPRKQSTSNQGSPRSRTPLTKSMLDYTVDTPSQFPVHTTRPKSPLTTHIRSKSPSITDVVVRSQSPHQRDNRSPSSVASFNKQQIVKSEQSSRRNSLGSPAVTPKSVKIENKSLLEERGNEDSFDDESDVGDSLSHQEKQIVDRNLANSTFKGDLSILDYERILLDVIENITNRHMRLHDGDAIPHHPHHSDEPSLNTSDIIDNNPLVNSYQTAVRYLMGKHCEELKQQVTDHIKWLTGLCLSGSIGTFMPNHTFNQNESNKVAISRMEDAAKSLCELDRSLCNRVSNLSDYYSTMTKCLSKDMYYSECYLRDGLGVMAFNTKNSFCVVSKEKYNLEMYLAGDQFAHSNVCAVTKIRVNFEGRDIQHQCIQLQYDKEREASKLSFPVVISGNMDDSTLEASPFDESDINELSGPAHICTAPLRISFMSTNPNIDGNKNSSTKPKRHVYHMLINIPLIIFEYQSSVDRIYAPIKEKVTSTVVSLPIQFRSVSLFSHRTISRFASTTSMNE
ncbi:hypothetical protein AKO1_005398 [Acrasis kona]|uniref:Uncharacterized protein n=1 Tax=Acrasis kona TaxID=1008807 RepID=A0AAW2YM26_9EUKA